ncbi:MAG: glycosyltransferase 87 family protein [Mycobacterium sp.]|nr:glycosyltransferase 87 family protein [Mycobacterium sp.]HNM83774.1 glycosyltransferase 87 family protein [Mycobacterium sp.]
MSRGQAGRRIAWRVFQLCAAAAFGYAGWRLLGHTPYRIDIDVYRMGGRCWLDGRPLYSGDTSFHTQAGADLPFTYPPLSAILFAPFALLSLPAASAAITALTLVLLVVSTVIVLTRLDVCAGPGWAGVTREPAWVRCCWVAMALIAPAVVYLEPIRSNFDFGQVNVVLMTLVLADTVPRRIPWPRGVLLGLAIALKLTPAVFLVYFAVRRDGRAVAVALASFAGATLLGFLLAWRDSWEYWTTTIRDTDRIGNATLNTNQNIAAALARLGLSDNVHFLLWAAACLAVLAVTVWATRRLLRSGGDSGPVLALICVAMFGLAVSPVSWSHHWVWTLPTLVVTAVVAWRKRDAALAAVTLVGAGLMVWTPIDLMRQHHETEAGLWRQLAGASYLWWALAVIVVAGLTAARPEVSRPLSAGDGPAAGRQPAAAPALHPL